MMITPFYNGNPKGGNLNTAVTIDPIFIGFLLYPLIILVVTIVMVKIGVQSS